MHKAILIGLASHSAIRPFNRSACRHVEAWWPVGPFDRSTVRGANPGDLLDSWESSKQTLRAVGFERSVYQVPGCPVCCGSARNQRPRGPVSLKATIFIRSLAHQSCFLVNPCAPPRSRTRVVGAGPFARTSVRRVFRRAFTAALPSCGLVSSIGGGRPRAQPLKYVPGHRRHPLACSS